MAHILISKRRAYSITMALFLVGLAIVSFTENWWPGILLVIGLPLALKQVLNGKTYDAVLTCILFIGTFIIVFVPVPHFFLLPVLFITGAVFLLAREFSDSFIHPEDEEEEELNHEIEEDREDHQ